MSRYNDVLTLVTVTGTDVDDQGNQTIITEESRVFANQYALGLTAWAAARSTGLHADARFAIRSCDYKGQQRVVYDGTEYEVEKAACKGEDTVLTLKKRLSNA